jgi:hypothetical protein
MKTALVLVLALAATGSAAAAKTPLPEIRSPSGNIRCLFVPGHPDVLRCDIGRADYAKALQQRCITRATVDWHGFELPAAGKGAVTCSGGILYSPDTQRPTYTTLPYGRSWSHGVFTCSSRMTGLTCRNRAGHGLFISRESWRAW